MTDFSPSAALAPPMIIQNAQVLLPSGELAQKDVAIADGKITAVGMGLEVTADTQTINGEGLTLLPGVIAPHVQFCQPTVESLTLKPTAVAHQTAARQTFSHQTVSRQTTSRQTVSPQTVEHSQDLLADDLFTASCACARGGVTSFLEMPLAIPNGLSLTTTQAVLTEKLAIASCRSLVNYGFFSSATVHNSLDLHTVHPTCGIQLCMDSLCMDSGDKPLLVDTLAALEPIFAEGERLLAIQSMASAYPQDQRTPFSDFNTPVGHTDTKVSGTRDTGIQDTVTRDTGIQDHLTSLVITKQALALAKKYQRRLHILQVSTSAEVNLLTSENKPSWVTADVMPQHLLLDMIKNRAVEMPAPMHSPLGDAKRDERNQADLWQGLREGVIDFIATSHTANALADSHTVKDYQTYPRDLLGLSGVETSLALMLTQAKAGRCTVAQVSNWMSTAVAKAYNIPKKGLIETGYDADLVLVDLSTYRPVLKEELTAKGSWMPFAGWTLTGWPVITIIGGQVVYDHGNLDTRVRGMALQFDVN
ncbi:MAG: amidohydrolase family protein [Cyanobacteria bacterium P01_D01_bin.105]